MLEWGVWICIGVVTVVLVELLRLNLLLIRALESERKIEQPDGTSRDHSNYRVSVVIPAKDEGESLEMSVHSVLASDYENLEVILVNDRSADNTLEVMERLSREDNRITVVSISELPQGWTGKTHALFEGAKYASGDLLLFTDADTILDSECITRAARHLQVNKIDMLSLLPQFQERRFIENAVYPHLALGFSSMYPLMEVNNPNKEAALASGCFILISRDAYQCVGTWQQFKMEISEDVALAKALKAAGLKLNVARGGHLVRTRPFERLGDVQRFWKRAFYGGLERSIPKILRLTVNYVVLTVLFVLFLFSSALVILGKTSTPNLVLFVVSTIAMAAVVIPYGFVVREEQGSWWYGLTAPLGILVSAWIAGSALVAVISGRGVRWRGGVYR